MNLDKLEQIARAATPGPWRVICGNKLRTFNMISIQPPKGGIHESLSNTSPVARLPWYGNIGPANAAHIAAFDPPTALAILAVVRAARAVALSNGFDPALPNKQATMLAAVQALEGLKP